MQARACGTEDLDDGCPPPALSARPVALQTVAPEVGLVSDPRHGGYGPVADSCDRWVLRGDGSVQVEVTVSVVIPALNEALNLPYILPQIPPGIAEVIVVDGRSADGTDAVARSIRPDVRIVEQPGHGKGDALRAGFAAATGDIIVMLDADGSMSPREIPRFIEALAAGADVVTGSRLMEGGGSADLSSLRRLGNGALVRAFAVLYGLRQTDLCYGYMAFWRHALIQLDLDCDGFEIETLINIRAVQAGLQLTEVPSLEARRLHGNSNLRTFRDGFRVLRTLLRERRAAHTPAALTSTA